MYVLNKDKLYYVYMYTSPSGRSYIGRSCNSKDVRSGNDGSGYRGCSAFWNAIQKYGWENFEYRVLEKDISADNIDKRENYWIDYYHTSTDENGYNLLMPDGDRKTYTCDTREKLSMSHMGHKPWNKGKTDVYTDEALKRMSEAHKGRFTGENNPNYGKHLSEDTKEKLRQYRGEKSSFWGKRHTEESRKKMSKSQKGHPGLKGEKNPMYGKHLSSEARAKISEKLKGRFAGENNPMYGVHLSPSEETRKKLSDTSSKAVMQFDLDGNYIATYKSRKAAAEAVSGNCEQISACCRGRKKSHLGFQWCNLEDADRIGKYNNPHAPKNVMQILNGEVINIYHGLGEAAMAVGKENGVAISRCAMGKQSTAYGYEWRYCDETEYIQTA